MPDIAFTTIANRQPVISRCPPAASTSPDRTCDPHSACALTSRQPPKDFRRRPLSRLPQFFARWCHRRPVRSTQPVWNTPAQDPVRDRSPTRRRHGRGPYTLPAGQCSAPGATRRSPGRWRHRRALEPIRGGPQAFGSQRRISEEDSGSWRPTTIRRVGTGFSRHRSRRPMPAHLMRTPRSWRQHLCPAVDAHRSRPCA